MLERLSELSNRVFAVIQRYSALTRSLDPAIRSHQAIGAVALASFALGSIDSGEIGGGVTAGIAAILGWALARELAPDVQSPAIAAGIGAGVFQALIGGSELGVAWLVLVFLRILIRSVGASPTLLDLVVNLAVVVFVSDTVPGVLAALGVALALFLSPILPNPAPKSHRLWGVVYAVAALVAAATTSTPSSTTTSGVGWGLAALAGVAALGLLGETHPTSVGDLDGRRLNGQRLRLGRIELVILSVVIVVGTRGTGVHAIAPELFAVLATGASRLRPSASS